MKTLILAAVKDDDGVLTFEWVLLVTLLTIGIVSGLTAARGGIIDELADVAEAMVAVDQSYTVDFPLAAWVHTTTSTTSSDTSFLDAVIFVDCGRAGRPGNPNLPGQFPQIVNDTDS